MDERRGVACIVWYTRAVAKGKNGNNVDCYADLTGTYVFPTLFSGYPVFNVFSMELLILDTTPDTTDEIRGLLTDGMEKET